MKLKLIPLFLSLIILSSCANSKYFAQEFSGVTLEKALHTILKYNKKDGVYYDILENGGYLLNISQQRILSNNFETSFLKDLGLKEKENNIKAFESFNKKYSIVNKVKLEQAIFKGKPVYDKENYALNTETNKMEAIVKEYIYSNYSLENKYIKKLKLDTLSISTIKTECFVASAMPYITAEFTVSATQNGKTATTQISDNFLIEIFEKGTEFEYLIGYAFYFDEIFKEENFIDSMNIVLNKTEPTDTMQYIYDTIDMSKIDFNYKDNWLELSKYSKTISDKYLYFTHQAGDITKQINTQNPNYLNEIVFVGDSIFEGFTFYDLAYKENVLSKVGVGARNLLEIELTSNGIEYTMESFIQKRMPKTIYLMLGLNDINMVSENQYSKYYKEIIKSIKEIVPEANIVLTSITPIRKMSFSTPERLQRYNAEAKAIAENTQQVYFLDLFDYLSVNGILATKYSANDGIHFSISAYKLLINFINCHQIKEDFIKEDLKDLGKLEQMRQTPIFIDSKAIDHMIKSEKEKGKSSPMRETPKVAPETTVPPPVLLE